MTTTPPPRSTYAQSTDQRRSGRFAALPSHGLSTMAKVQLLLLKKHGQTTEEPSAPDDVRCYLGIYQEPLPPHFIQAVTELTAATAKKGRRTSATTPAALWPAGHGGYGGGAVARSSPGHVASLSSALLSCA
ncbi:hypothetical protein D1007_62405 [Hordeum vulgare]|nr:hypothetical protein D1007_62405 [Hordeum vulgare]